MNRTSMFTWSTITRSTITRSTITNGYDTILRSPLQGGGLVTDRPTDTKAGSEFEMLGKLNWRKEK